MTFEERQEQLDDVLARYASAPEPVAHQARQPQPVDLDDQELLDRARAVRNGTEFSRLYDAGDWEGRYPSQSEADLALSCMLAFWTGRDAGRIDRLFRSSGLVRPKWEERGDYRTKTIDAAIAATMDVYQPRSERTRGQKSVESEAGFQTSQESSGRNGLTDSALKESASPESVPLRDSRAGRSDSDPESVTDSGRPFSLTVNGDTCAIYTVDSLTKP